MSIFGAKGHIYFAILQPDISKYLGFMNPWISEGKVQISQRYASVFLPPSLNKLSIHMIRRSGWKGVQSRSEFHPLGINICVF